MTISDPRAGMETPRHGNDRAQTRPGAGIADPGRVPGGGTGRPDPEVPERCRRHVKTGFGPLSVIGLAPWRVGAGSLIMLV
jgi:hypothetical protein